MIRTFKILDFITYITYDKLQTKKHNKYEEVSDTMDGIGGDGHVVRTAVGRGDVPRAELHQHHGGAEGKRGRFGNHLAHLRRPLPHMGGDGTGQGLAGGEHAQGL